MAEWCRFTPPEGGARLAMSARRRNTLAVELGAFTGARLLVERAYAHRGTLSSGAQRSIFISRASRVACSAYELNILTSLSVTQAVEYADVESWSEELEVKEVIVCTSAVLRQLLQEGLLTMTKVNVLIIDSCHLIHTDEDLKMIMKLYKESPQQPRVLALTYPLFTSKRPEKSEGLLEEVDEKGDGTASESQPSDTQFGTCPNLDDFEMYRKLECKIEQLEDALSCHMDLAEDIDGGKRFSSSTTKPKELIVEYSSRRDVSADYEELEAFMRATIRDAQDWLDEHRYDPTEIYGEDLYEEFKNIPDPTLDPKDVFRQFLYILDELGPYGADKAAFSLLTKVEKLKIKVPYERHFLLLCLCTTVFVKIRCYADLIFSKYSDLDRINEFSTPKVLRFVEILAQFDGPDIKEDDEKIEEKKTETKCQSEPSDINVNENYREMNGITEDSKMDNETESESKLNNTNKLLNAIENCDFITLSNKIEDKINTYEANLKEIDSSDISNCEVKSKSVEVYSNGVKVDSKSEVDTKSSELNSVPENEVDSDPRSVLGLPKRVPRVRGRGRIQRSVIRNQLALQNPDALCGIVFMNEPLMAKILFLLVVDLSRSEPRLSHVCAQHCATTAAADGAEMRRQSRAREDALKKFRMHDCNLLLATSELEEGIDLPRCNLVLRWDVPPSYRSHGLCRARARAPRAACVLLSRAGTPEAPELLRRLATYRQLDEIISKKCGCGIQDEPSQEEEDHADTFTSLIQPYTPIPSIKDGDRDKHTPDEANRAGNDIGKYDGIIQATTPCVNEVERDKLTPKDEANRVAANDICVNEVERDKLTPKDEANRAANDRGKDDGIIQETTHYVNVVERDKHTPDEANRAANDIGKDDSIIQETTPCVNDVERDKLTPKDEANRAANDIGKDDGIIQETTPYIKDIERDKNIADNETEKKDKNIEEKHTENGDLTNERDFNINSITEKVKELTCHDNAKVFSEVKSDKENLACNKCGKVRTSVEIDCCAIVDNVEGDRSEEIASVDLSSAIALINRYCGKLPSDTFTRLAPSWRTERVRVPALPTDGQTDTQADKDGMVEAWVCTLRLPLNCPVKYNIVGHPMPTRALARRMAALQACRILHKSGELDDQLMPIGKENLKAAEVGGAGAGGGGGDARPGTTKRRQYYYKRTARAFTNCEPVVDSTDEQIEEAPNNCNANILYAISCTLWCALPERYNTRGRRLHAPQHANQAIGILMQAHPPPHRLKIPSFPVYTRSGEVRVTVSPANGADTRISPTRKIRVQCFMRFVFAEVLRVRRRGMTLQTEGSTHNNYYVVPTIKVQNPDGSARVDIDWKFLEEIYQYTENMKNTEIEKPMVWKTDDDGDDKTENSEKKRVKKMDNPLLKPGETFVFDAEKYKEAVVTPWYRNQDQPQFFLVAEICWNLTPDSAFPSATHTSFREYYSSKYGVTLTQPDQPLLDVDHTSARLNLLTPRYVNRKGVALPVSSERTRRAKRDRLDQKQILVPELCAVHPFAAPLWFATVALPCVLYRINALLIADEIRRAVAADVGLGTAGDGVGTWPALDFGWSLADVLHDRHNKEEPLEKESEKETETEGDKEETKETNTEEPKEKTINEILQEKEAAASGFEIGTWDNDMAASIPSVPEYDELSEPLPTNLTFVTSPSGGANWCDPVQKPKSQFNPTRTFSMADSDCSYMSSDFDTDDSDLNSEGSDDETDSSGFCSNKSNAAMGVRIEYKTAHEAEAVDLERQPVCPAPTSDPDDDGRDRGAHAGLLRAGDVGTQYLEKFEKAVESHKQDIINQGLLVEKDTLITDLLPAGAKELRKPEEIPPSLKKTKFQELFPYKNGHLNIDNGVLSLENIEKNKRELLAEFRKTLSKEEIRNLTCFSMIDVDIDSPDYKNEKISNIGFDSIDSYIEKAKSLGSRESTPYFEDGKGMNGKEFDFDYQPNLEGHPGPSPSVILQALTMSNANDGINLERLETIGDSFLKFAITAYLYCAQPTVHEGKLSHMRSKQVSNLNLYRLGVRRRLGTRMTASKFEPHDNWLPPAHRAPPAAHHPVDSEEAYKSHEPPPAHTGCFIPYNLITQHSIPDKSIADCVEALIGAYLLECGPRGALLFMAWLGIRVLPSHDVPITDPTTIAKLEAEERQNRRRHDSSSEDEDDTAPTRPVGSLAPRRDEKGQWVLPMFGDLKAPPSPLLRYIEDPEGELEQMLSGYDALERTLQYRFRDRSLLLQALTHASHQRNRLTDCYQRLEFLGDAVLDYLITRHLYEDPRRHSPGALTDLRSALVNNTIFATLAARHSFHKYFRHMSPGLNEVLTKYVKIQEENGHSISEEHYLIHEDELEQAEDVEVPKALGDLFESVAGAIFLDSGMSLAAVWRSYELLMGAELEAFSAAAPKSPVRELLEAEPDTAKFGKPERLADGRRVRVCVEVFGRGAFKGVGRNYRIAKGTAARCALRHLRRHKH